MNFALASMDALVNPFFWTWKVSHVLRCHRYLWGALGSIASLSSFWLTFLRSRSPKRVSRAQCQLRLSLPRPPKISLLRIFWIRCP